MALDIDAILARSPRTWEGIAPDGSRREGIVLSQADWAAVTGEIEKREIHVKRLLMAVQFVLNSLPTMREETRHAGLAHIADQIERNREGLARIMASVEADDTTR